MNLFAAEKFLYLLNGQRSEDDLEKVSLQLTTLGQCLFESWNLNPNYMIMPDE